MMTMAMICYERLRGEFPESEGAGPVLAKEWHAPNCDHNCDDAGDDWEEENAAIVIVL